jgi:hypothetical protein
MRFSVCLRERPGRTIAAISMLLSILMLASGCVSAITDRKLNDEGLREAVTIFNDAIRWRDYQQALVWVPPQQRDVFWKQTDAVQDNLRIVDYQILRLDFSERTTIGSTDLRYRYYSLTNPRIESVTLHQKWRWDEVNHQWLVVQSDLETLVDTQR